MREIRVTKSELLGTMRENRKNHMKIVEEAQEGFRKAVQERLEAMLEDARKGKRVDMYIGLQVPESHLDDYDTVIGMLEMDINETVDLDMNQYRQWVQDDWGWQQSFTTSNAYYSATAAASL